MVGEQKYVIFPEPPEMKSTDDLMVWIRSVDGLEVVEVGPPGSSNLKEILLGRIFVNGDETHRENATINVLRAAADEIRLFHATMGGIRLYLRVPPEIGFFELRTPTLHSPDGDEIDFYTDTCLFVIRKYSKVSFYMRFGIGRIIDQDIDGTAPYRPLERPENYVGVRMRSK